MRGPHPQSHLTLRYSGHVTNKKRYNSTFTRPMYPKRCSMLTQDERTAPTKSRDTLTLWSRDKSNALYLHFHKAYGPQTQQGGDQDDETSATKSRETSIKWSRDKSKIFYLHFHTVQGPQTQQSGNCKNKKTPRNMSCPRLCRHVTTAQQVVHNCSASS